MESAGANAAMDEVQPPPSGPLATGEAAEEVGLSTADPMTDDAGGLLDLAEAVREVGPIDSRRWPAGFGVRAGAVLFDGIILGFLVILIVLPAELILSAVLPFGDREAIGPLLLLTVMLLYSATEAFATATPGKSILGLRVVRRNGEPAATRRRTLRWAIKNAPLLLVAATAAIGIALMAVPSHTANSAPVSGLMSALVDTMVILIPASAMIVAAGCFGALLPGRRALHDFLSGTAVYRDEDVRKPSAFRVFGFAVGFRSAPPGEAARPAVAEGEGGPSVLVGEARPVLAVLPMEAEEAGEEVDPVLPTVVWTAEATVEVERQSLEEDSTHARGEDR